jgi:hypothetical protein
MPKRRSIKKTQTANISHNVIAYKLDEIKEIVNRNSKDIEDLKKQMAMGTGGIKAVFVIGALVAMFFSIFSGFKFWGN